MLSGKNHYHNNNVTLDFSAARRHIKIHIVPENHSIFWYSGVCVCVVVRINLSVHKHLNPYARVHTVPNNEDVKKSDE